MFGDFIDRESERFGSASFASEADLRRAGLYGTSGLPVGYGRDGLLRLNGDAPALTIGGSGTGKLTTLLAYTTCLSPQTPMLILDPKGEMADISLHTLAPAGVYGWIWSPLSGGFSCNVLDIIKPDSPHFHAITKFIVEGLIALSHGNGKYFELRAREWLEAIVKALAERDGHVSFASLYRVINLIEGDPGGWADFLQVMLESRFADVRRAATEMLVKQQDTPKEFGSILGEIYAHTSFLNDPRLLAALEPGELSLAALVDPGRVSRIYLNVPAEFLGIWSPLLRVIFTVAMLYKSLSPGGRRVLLLIDEAGQLGRFEGLIRAFTYGRGAGVRCWALFQDIGQLQTHYGAAGVQTFIGSAQLRQFFGVRDYQTAELVSNMLGVQTLAFDDTLAQSAARKQAYNAATRALLFGEDAFSVGADYAHAMRAATNRAKQARPLLTPAEVLALPDDRQLLFISGLGLRPILGWRYPYFERREMAGRYLPNRNHPPLGSVQIATAFGRRRARVIHGRVPEKYRDFPQYRSGHAAWIEGYPL